MRRWKWPLALVALLLLAWSLLLPMAFPSLLRWALDRASAGWAGHTLQFESAQLRPWSLAAQVDGLNLRTPQGESLASIGHMTVDVSVRSLPLRALVLDTLRLESPTAKLLLNSQGHNWAALLQAMQDPSQPPEANTEPPRFRVESLRVKGAEFLLNDARLTPARAFGLESVDLALDAISTLPEDRGSHTLSALTDQGTRMAWRGQVSLAPLAAEGEVQVDALNLPQLFEHLTWPLRSPPPDGKVALSLRYQVDARKPGEPPQWRLFDGKLQLADFALRERAGGEPALALSQLQLEGVALDSTTRRATVARLHNLGGSVSVAIDAQGRPTVLDVLPVPPSNSASSPPTSKPASTPPAATETAWQFALPLLDLQGVALSLEDASRKHPLQVRATSSSLQGALNWDGSSLVADGLTLTLEGLSAQSKGGTPWFQMDALNVSGIRVDSAAQLAAVGELLLKSPQLAVHRAADGALNVLDALQSRDARPPASRRALAAAPSNASWRWRIEQLRLNDGQVRWQDAGLQPAAELSVEGLRVNVQGLDDGLNRDLPLQAVARLRSGGSIGVQGKVHPQGRADLNLRVQSLALAAAQPYLAPHTLLVLKEGQAHLQGRLQVGQSQAAWSFQGRVGLHGLRLNEPDRAEPFLALTQMDAPRLALTPQHLALGDITLDGLRSSLLIDANRRINLDRVQRPKDDAVAPEVPSASPADGAASAAPRTRVSLERLRLRNTTLDFADLSLALPFAARIHGLAGEIAGLDSLAGAEPASLQLEGTVAPVGLARAGGRLQPLAPTAFSDVRVNFRNIEMASLSPYTATFAGRRIASGTMSLALDYQLRERQLVGDNRIVMERLQLGERVEAPGATSLPLDLAIALLEDSEGRIELGLPVRGNLDSPEFSYGGLVWKALVNVVTKIATSPFRALGALFGGNDDLADRLSQVDFDPGSARLTPPQMEKMQQVAKALTQRPNLVVQPGSGVAPEADSLALRQQALAQRVMAREGRGSAAPKEQTDEAPRALVATLPATRRALAELHALRFGEASTQLLAEQHASANGQAPSLTQRLVASAKQAIGKPPVPLSADQLTALRASPLPELQWQQLLAAETLPEGALEALGQARAKAVAQALQAAGLGADRLAPAAAQTAELTPDGVRLRLGVQAQTKTAVVTATPAPAEPNAPPKP